MYKYPNGISRKEKDITNEQELGALDFIPFSFSVSNLPVSFDVKYPISDFSPVAPLTLRSLDSSHLNHLTANYSLFYLKVRKKVKPMILIDSGRDFHLVETKAKVAVVDLDTSHHPLLHACSRDSPLRRIDRRVKALMSMLGSNQSLCC